MPSELAILGTTEALVTASGEKTWADSTPSTKGLIMKYTNLDAAPEGYYIDESDPDFMASSYTGPYGDHYLAHHARIVREQEMADAFKRTGLMSSAITMVLYHKG